MMKKLNVFQLKKVYDRGPKFALYRGLKDLTFGILGVGSMGLEGTASCHTLLVWTEPH